MLHDVSMIVDYKSSSLSMHHELPAILYSLLANAIVFTSGFLYTGMVRRLVLFQQFFVDFEFFLHAGDSVKYFVALLPQGLANGPLQFVLDCLQMHGRVMCIPNGLEIRIGNVGILDQDGTALPRFGGWSGHFEGRRRIGQRSVEVKPSSGGRPHKAVQ